MNCSTATRHHIDPKKIMNNNSPLQKLLTLLLLLAAVSIAAFGQNVVVLVIDGARYSETFGAKAAYMPDIWTTLRPKGTIWTDFRNDSITKTDPGHSTIETGIWQNIDNSGLDRPHQPTFFEYFRKASLADEQSTAVIVGKKKLDILTYSTDPEYGKEYRSAFYLDSSDMSVFTRVKNVLIQKHPRLVLINFPSVDIIGHKNDWNGYLSAIKTADSLVLALWNLIQSDSFYRNSTTLFVTNDHGRHDDEHGGFSNHGCSCEGCRHIMLFAIGRNIPAGGVVTAKHTQCDIAPTAGVLLSFPTPKAIGTNLLLDISNSSKY